MSNIKDKEEILKFYNTYDLVPTSNTYESL